MGSYGDRLQGTPQRIEEKIVIVGGGIGGLACALALHRYKITSELKLLSKHIS